MADAKTGTAPKRSPWRRAPLVVLALFLAAVAAIAVWLTLAGPPERPAVAAAPLVVDIPERIYADDAEPQPAEPPANVATAPTPADPVTDPEPAGTEMATAPQAPAPEPAAQPSDPQPPAVAPAPAALPPMLTDVPVPELVEVSDHGPLPVVSADGRTPWQVYRRPFDMSDPRPRIALVISELGISTQNTEAAITALPADVTLAFMPFWPGTDAWLAAARADGHETLLAMPMEPLSYPRDDPGPNPLLVSATDEQNLNRLHMALGQGSGYVGVMNHQGSRFTANPQALRPVLGQLQLRGLVFVDSRSGRNSIVDQVAGDIGLVHAINDRIIDADPSPARIRRQLAALEQIARTRGTAVGLGFASYPSTLAAVTEWAAGLEAKGIALAPITAVVKPPGSL